VSTPDQEFISQQEFENRTGFEPRVNEEISYQNPYEQPLTEQKNYMGVFNKKEDVKVANESGVDVSFFDEVKKSVNEAEMPYEYLASANHLKNKIEKLKQYYPESAQEIGALDMTKLNSRNVNEYANYIRKIENKYDQQYQGDVLSPMPYESDYRKEVKKGEDYVTAIKMLEDDNIKLQKSTEGSDIIGGNVAKGVQAGIGDYVKGYTELLSTLKGNKAVNAVLNKVESKEELTTEDKLLLAAIVENAKIHGDLDKRIPTSYKVGEALGTSAGFMGEFVLTGGAASGIGESILKQAAKKGITGGAKKLGLNVAIKLAQTGVQTPLMPSLYQKTALDVSKGEDFWKAFGNDVWQTAAETGSERVFLMNPVKGGGAAADRFLRTAGINFSADKGAVGVLRNMGEEYLEEKVGEIMTAPKDYNSFKEFWKGFTDKEQNLVTFGSTALLTGGMGSVGLAGDAVSKARYQARVAKAEKLLPSDLKAEMDAVLDNKDLTAQQQFDLVSEIIGKRIDNEELTEDPSTVAANAVAYAVSKTQVASAESADKNIKVENGEFTVGEVEENVGQQEQLDYLKNQGVKVPDGTTTEQLQKLYDETKNSDETKKRQQNEKAAKIQFVSERGIEVAEDVSDNELDKVYRQERVKKIKEDNVEFDAKIAESQQRLGLATTPDIDVSDDTELTLDQIDNEESVPNVFVKKASDELYKIYNDLEAMKQSDSRVYTTEQIESMQLFLEEEITKLEEYANKQAETGEFIGKTKVGETTERGTTEVVAEVKQPVSEDGTTDGGVAAPVSEAALEVAKTGEKDGDLATYKPAPPAAEKPAETVSKTQPKEEVVSQKEEELAKELKDVESTAKALDVVAEKSSTPPVTDSEFKSIYDDYLKKGLNAEEAFKKTNEDVSDRKVGNDVASVMSNNINTVSIPYKNGFKKLRKVFIRFGEPRKDEKGNYLASSAYAGSKEGQKQEGVSVFEAGVDPITGKYIISTNEATGLSLMELMGQKRDVFLVDGEELSARGEDFEPQINPSTYRQVEKLDIEDVLDDNEIGDIDLDLVNESLVVSEAYHKAKQDGSNPELVSAVDRVLNKFKNKQDGSDGQEVQERTEPMGEKPEVKTEQTGSKEGKGDTEAAAEERKPTDTPIPAVEPLSPEEGVIAQPKEKVAEKGVKEPWEMTGKEYVAFYLKKSYEQEYGSMDGFDIWMKSPMSASEKSDASNNAVDVHEMEVQQAIADGKQVPENVLKDYPELRVESPALTPEKPRVEENPQAEEKKIVAATSIKPC